MHARVCLNVMLRRAARMSSWAVPSAAFPLAAGLVIEAAFLLAPIRGRLSASIPPCCYVLTADRLSGWPCFRSVRAARVRSLGLWLPAQWHSRSVRWPAHVRTFPVRSTGPVWSMPRTRAVWISRVLSVHHEEALSPTSWAPIELINLCSLLLVSRDDCALLLRRRGREAEIRQLRLLRVAPRGRAVSSRGTPARCSDPPGTSSPGPWKLLEFIFITERTFSVCNWSNDEISTSIVISVENDISVYTASVCNLSNDEILNSIVISVGNDISVYTASVCNWSNDEISNSIVISVGNDISVYTASKLYIQFNSIHLIL